MSIWHHYELGERAQRLAHRGEERLALDRSSGRPVTVCAYGGVAADRKVLALPALLPDPAPNLAQPLELFWEGAEPVVVRQLAFGPSLEDLLALGPQPESVVAALLNQVLAGLAPLHAAGRAHLRLAPSSIRFDLLEGALKVTDLEVALLLPGAPDPSVAPYLEARGGAGPGDASEDIYSLGRLGEALLRGAGRLSGGPVGTPVVTAVAPQSDRGALWEFLQHCQRSREEGRPANAAAAIALLASAGLPCAPAFTLPIGAFVRRHVRALRQLRRWRAQPLPPLGRPSVDGYREIVSSREARRLWGLVGLSAAVSVVLSLALASTAGHGAEVSAIFDEQACVPEAESTPLEQGESAPVGFSVLTLEVPAGAAVAIDGCPVPHLKAGTVRLSLSRGMHDLRAAIGEDVISQRVEIKGAATPEFDLRSVPVAHEPRPAALDELARQLRVGAGARPDPEAFDPMAAGMLDPVSQHVLAADTAVALNNLALRSALPDDEALALDGLRAADRRFAVAGTVCAARLSTEAAKRLGSGSGPTEQAIARATEFLTVTRLRGPALPEPLRLEAEGLARLGIEPNQRILSAVAELSATPEIAQCLSNLAPKAAQVDELSALVISQLADLAPDNSQRPPQAHGTLESQ